MIHEKKAPPVTDGSGQLQMPNLNLGTNLADTDAWKTAITKELPEGVREDSALSEAFNHHSNLRQSWLSVDEMRRKRNPNDTPAAHLAKVQKTADKLVEQFAQRGQNVLDRIKARRTELERASNERLGLQETPDAAEIRSVLRSLDDDKRNEVIQDAIKSKDSAILAAVFSGKPITTGVPANRTAALKAQALNLHAKDLLALDKSLERAQELVSNSFTDSIALSGKVAGDPAFQSKFIEQQKAADEAMLNVARTLGLQTL